MDDTPIPQSPIATLLEGFDAKSPRVRLFLRLLRSAETGPQLQKELGLSRSIVRHHLTQLQLAGIVTSSPAPTGQGGSSPIRWEINHALVRAAGEELTRVVADA